MKRINGKELKKKIRSKTKLLDIDSRDDFRQCHILNSVNIPYDETDFISQVREIVPNRHDELVLCGKPYNSRELYMAIEKLEEIGYDKVFAHALGQQDWRRSGVEIIELRWANKEFYLSEFIGFYFL